MHRIEFHEKKVIEFQYDNLCLKESIFGYSIQINILFTSFIQVLLLSVLFE